MTHLKDTLAHILEHQHRLEDANQPTTKQYVVLPILRALGWHDANLASMDILPRYDTGIESDDDLWEESLWADYALIVNEVPKILIECQAWGAALVDDDKQLGAYAIHTGVPIVVLTNGKLWRFYLSWRPNTRLRDRVFCETDIENLNEAVADLTQYLSKANVASGDAELDAEIALEEEAAPVEPEREFARFQTAPTVAEAEAAPVEPEPRLDEAIRDNIAIIREGAWTAERVRAALPPEIRDYHATKYPEERREVCYRAVAEIQNLIEAEGWQMNAPKLNKSILSFMVTSEAARTRQIRAFGVILDAGIPHSPTVDRNGEKLQGSLATIPPRIFVQISPEEALQLERQYGCEFSGHSGGWCVYYKIPDNIEILLPALELAYRKRIRD